MTSDFRRNSAIASMVGLAFNTPARELREAGEAAARAGLGQVRLRDYDEPPPICTGAILPAALAELEIPVD
jgi:hypothetical protein